MNTYMKYTRQLPQAEIEALAHLEEELFSPMVPHDEILQQLGMFLTTQNMCRILFMLEIYKRIIDVPGVILDFGTRYGQNMALFTTFRSIFEPYNFTRRVIGFDTFCGFPSVSNKDGTSASIEQGNYSTAQRGGGYGKRLAKLIRAHEAMTPLGHIAKSEVIEGDVCITFEKYLDAHPELIVSLAYFDMDLYEPTKFCLERTIKVMPKGAILGFDELNHPSFPGETVAFKECMAGKKIRLERIPYASRPAFCVVE